MSTGDVLGLLNLIMTIAIVFAFLVEQRRAMRAEAAAEMWKRMAQKLTDRMASRLEDLQ